MFHLLLGKGHEYEVISNALERAVMAVDADRLASLLNTQVGTEGLGCVDSALKNCSSVVSLLKGLGATEQPICGALALVGQRSFGLRPSYF